MSLRDKNGKLHVNTKGILRFATQRLMREFHKEKDKRGGKRHVMNDHFWKQLGGCGAMALPEIFQLKRTDARIADFFENETTGGIEIS